VQELYPPSGPPEELAVYERLDDLYGELYDRLESAGLAPDDVGSPASAEGQKLPLLTLEMLELPAEPAAELLAEICDLLEAEGEGSEELGSFCAELEASELEADELIVRRLSGQQIGRMGEVCEEILDLVVVLTARPFLRWFADHVDGLEERSVDWMEGICPFCGATPELGCLTDDEGQRMLFCWLCGTEWRFHRLKCPYCGEEEADGHRYFTLENTPYRVDLCGSCNCYLKTVDERKLNSARGAGVSWVVNDLLSLHLDVAAQEEGFAPPK